MREAQLLLFTHAHTLWVGGLQFSRLPNHRSLRGAEAKAEDAGSRYPPHLVTGLGGHRCQHPVNARSQGVPPAAPCTLLMLSCQRDKRRCRFLHWPQIPAHRRTATAQRVEASARRTYRQVLSLRRPKLYQLPFMQRALKHKSLV